MKNLALLTLLLISISKIIAQDPEKELKKADRLLGLYFLDTKSNNSKLWEAKNLIDGLSENSAVSGMYKTWITKGNIYNAISSTESDSLLLGETKKKPYTLKYADAGLTAYHSLLKAKSLATKTFETKDVLNAITESSRYLNNFGTEAVNAGNYKSAFLNFMAVLEIDKIITTGGLKTLFDDAEEKKKQMYITAACAVNADMTDQVVHLLEELKNADYKEPVIYEGLFKYYLTRDEAKAEAILAEGRSKLPEETSLLYTEINHYLKKGKLEMLIDNLKLALSKEPDNISVSTTLGNVYDNMCQKEWAQGYTAKGEEYYKQAETHYLYATQKAPDNFDANYSLGALYYNKAAVISKEANKMSSDYSKEGTRKYNAKKAEMESFFDKALPFLENAEKIDPKDKSTLVALKEIYARKGQLDKSNSFKAKLEALESGKN